MGDDRYYPSLDGLRGVAALCVVLIHRGGWFGLHGWLEHGYLAVDFFFMLSGFVIANAYEDRLRRGASVLAFCRARVLRLYPMIVLGTAIGAAWALYSMPFAPGGATAAQVAALAAKGVATLPTLAANPIGMGIFPLDAPAWSLFFEMLANVAFALTLRWMTTRRLIAVVLASALALAAMALIYGTVDRGATPASFWGGLPRTAFPFFFGVLLYRARNWAPLQWPKAPVWVQAALLLAAFNIPGARGLGGGLIDLACVMLAFPAVIALSIRSRPAGAALPACKWLGEISYPVYILHYPIYVVIGGLGFHYDVLDQSTKLGFGLASLAVILAASQAALSWYDKPVRRRLGGLGGGKPGMPEGAAAVAGSTGT